MNANVLLSGAPAAGCFAAQCRQVAGVNSRRSACPSERSERLEQFVRDSFHRLGFSGTTTWGSVDPMSMATGRKKPGETFHFWPESASTETVFRLYFIRIPVTSLPSLELKLTRSPGRNFSIAAWSRTWSRYFSRSTIRSLSSISSCSERWSMSIGNSLPPNWQAVTATTVQTPAQPLDKAQRPAVGWSAAATCWASYRSRQ